MIAIKIFMIGGINIMLVYDSLFLKYNGFEFELHFSNRILLLTGDSGLGKTYLYRVLSENSNNYAIRAFNKYTSFLEDNLKLCNNSLIVIDNADYILDDKLRKMILFDPNNQYLIIGRDCAGLNLTRDCLVTLRKEGNRIEMNRL